jgi:arylsulfatase A-like enzyme
MNAFSWASRDIIWMAPLSYAVFIVPITVLAMCLVTWWPRYFSGRLLISAPLTVAMFGVLLLVRVIHPLALLAISLGVSIQIARLFARYSAWGRRMTRTVVVGGGTLVLIGSAAVRGLPALAESTAIAAASDASAPNVLLIILDTVRASNMGLYGYFRSNTPRLEQLARDGVRFDRAIAPASWTLPTHVSLFSGLDARTVAARWSRSMHDSVRTLAQVLSKSGYVSAGFAANPQYTTWETGLGRGFHRWVDIEPSIQETFWASSIAQTSLVRDFILARGPVGRWRAIRSFNLTVPVDPHHVRRPGADIVDDFLDWHASIDSTPFLGFLNLFDAHDPYVEPPSWTPRYAPRTSVIDTYDSAIAYMDAQVGRLVDSLERRGVLDETIVIISSDHGEQFGEHGLKLHGNSLYMNSIHVPLLIRAPQRTPAGVVVDVPVSLSAIPATVLDLAEVAEGELPGQSLRELWDGDPVADSAIALSWIQQHPWGKPGEPATDGALTSLVDGTYHWILSANDRVALYAYRADSLELLDRGSDPSLAGVRDSFRVRARLPRRP